MGMEKLSGTVLIVLFLFGHLTVVLGGQQLRRFLQNGGNAMPFGGSFPMQMGPNIAHCGPYQCANGDCSYSQQNGVDLYHTCTCHHGWTGDACDRQIGSHGSNQGYCGQHQCIHGSCSVNTNTGFMAHHTCTCNHGWTGDACDKQKVSPMTTQRHYDSACNNHGQMTSSGCYCHDKWSGDICQYPPGYGHHDHCNNNCEHGTCVGHLGNPGYYFDCKCDKGWHGSHCTQYTLSTTTAARHYDSECNNHGQNTSSGCNCHDNWSGDICQYPPGYGHHDHCNNDCAHGTCVGHIGSHGYYFNCKCDQGWHGGHCTNYAPTGSVQCHNTYCMHGTCIHYQNHHGYWHYYCRCSHGWDGQQCDQQLTTAPSTTHSASSTSTPVMTSSTSTPTITTTTTTTPAPTHTTRQTTLPPASATTFPATSTTPLSTTVTTPSISSAAPVTTCDHLGTLSALARQVLVANPNAIECFPGNHTSHEAFILTECAVPQIPSSWQQGINVMTDCGSSASIPTYTPIAAFDQGLYSSVGSLSGIFLGCTSNGFKIALQTCGQTPSMVELQLGGSNTRNPNMYYTLS